MAKVRIEMLKDDRGSQTGSTVEEFEKGKQYNVSEELAACFVSTKSAQVMGDALEEQEEGKDAGESPENKDAGAPEGSKSRRRR